MYKLFYVVFVLLNVILASSAHSTLTVKVEDTNLTICIEQTMQKKGYSNIEQLLTLKCHNKNVKSIIGLEAFTNLTNLSLYNNQIVSADLSKLTKLEHVNFAKNKLTTIQLQGLQKLESLYLFKNNLTTIDFKGLKSLTKMRIMQNQLEALDISPLISIVEIYLWDNKLEDLQINGLIYLKFMDVKQNPMPDELYDFYDEQEGITISHDGNADDWK